MSYATRASSGALRAIRALGHTCTVIRPNGAWQPNGSVPAGSEQWTNVTCSDVLNESQRYASQSTDVVASGTIYFPTIGLPFTPMVKDRVVYLGVAYDVIAKNPFRIQGTIAAWQVDVVERGPA